MKTFEVVTERGVIIVLAAFVSIDDDQMLIFSEKEGGPLVAVFASGFWNMFNVVKAEPTAPPIAKVV